MNSSLMNNSESKELTWAQMKPILTRTAYIVTGRYGTELSLEDERNCLQSSTELDQYIK